MTDKIRISNISKTFMLLGKRRKKALGGVGLTIMAGDFLVILGRSGCGKSTLLNIVAGMISPTDGEVVIDGHRVTGPEPSRILLTQQPTLLPWLTVAENVAFGCRLRGEDADLQDRVTTVLERVQMEGQGGYFPGELSLGMQQRVCLARSLMGDPDILLLDEPFGALDTFTRFKLHEQMIQIRKASDMTVIFVTHDLDEALALGSRVVLLGGDPGHIVADFPVDSPYPRDSADPGLRKIKIDIMNLFWEMGA